MIVKEPTTQIGMTEAEALLFIEFQKRFAFMKALETMGAFSLKNGSITIHFDNLGRIAKVDKHEAFKIYEAS